MEWQEHHTGPPADWHPMVEGGYTDDDGVRWCHRPHRGWERARVQFLDARQGPPWWRRLASTWRWVRRGPG